MASPVISVVIPAYQHAASLPGCLESVFAQQDVRTEIIVVDDGSTDATLEVLETYKVKGVRVIHQENQGANPARNRGLAEATGEYVIVLDADIIMRPTMLRDFLAQLQAHPEASYAYGSFYFGWKHFHGVPFSAERLRRMNFIHTSALVRRVDHPGFDPAVKRFQDWDVWLTMLERGRVGVLVPGTYFLARIDGKSRIGSSWLPSFVYRLPWRYVGWKPKRVAKYEAAREAIKQKHNL